MRSHPGEPHTYLRIRVRRAAVVVCSGTLVLGSAGLAQADLTPDPLRDPASESVQTLQRNVLAKATPDRCYYGTDVPMGAIDPDGTCPTKTFTVGETTVTREGTLKVNQAYVWGLAKSANHRLWWGTGPNIHCLVMSGYLGQNNPVETSSYVCDPDQNFVPPDIFMYDEVTGVQTKLNSRVSTADATKFGGTLGIRSAGAADGVVFFAGPAYTGGINIFAFDDTTGAYLGSTSFAQYTNIRKWVLVNGELYTGVAVKPSTEHPKGGGMIMRWTGSRTDPFQFENVGYIDGEGAELAEHDGRLFVATWPCCESETVTDEAPAGVWMSPLFGSDHMLKAADLNGWTKVWSTADYDPDPIIGSHYGGGALVSYGGQLYWGTMHVPGTALAELSATYGEEYPDEMGVEAYIRANRAIVIFRGDNFTDGKTDTPIEVLYGDAQEWAFDGETGTWSQKPTGGHAGTPTGGGSYGASGFGTPFNNYTWTMSVYNGQMFVGTMDYTYLIEDMLDEPQPEVTALQESDNLFPTLANLIASIPMIKSGADLWRFPAPGSKAVPESLEGVGNYLNYGVRTMLGDSDALYIGSANPMNLMTDKTDAYPEGGWELIKLTAKAVPPPPPSPSDTTAPVSKASAPAVSTAATWQVTYTATDNSSGVGKVELFVKKPGATTYVSAGVDTTSLDGKFAFDSGGVEGDYAFYTVATDKSGNIEAVPATPDAVTEYTKAGPVITDLTAPVSKARSPKVARHESFRVHYAAKDESAGSGLAKVELFVKAPGAASYSKVAVDSADRIDGKFRYTASAGEGVYQFYTVATDVAGNVEKAPAKADTTTLYDHTPAMIHRRMGKGPFVLDLGDHDRLMLRMRTSEQVFATFLIRHEGKLVKQFGPKLVGKGLVTRYWNGTDLDKKLCEPGRYTLVMKVKDMAGNTTLLRTHLRIHQ
ncbi:Ig-like domain repeat protein [Nocardioides pakistanensis]